MNNTMRVTKFLVKNCHEIFSSQSVSALLKSLSSNERKLFDALSTKVEMREKDIEVLIYGEVSPNNRSYARMKAKLRDKLIDIELLNVAGNAIQRAKKKLGKKRLLVESLQLMGNRSAFVKAAESCLKDALDIGIFDIAADMCRRLSIHHLQFARCSKEGYRYRTLHDQYYNLYNKELDAEWRFAEAVHMSNGTTSKSEKLADAVSAMRDTIELENDSSRLHFFWYCLGAIAAHLRGDIPLKTKICKEALVYFENLYYKHNLTIAIFRRMLITTYVSNNQLALAENIIHMEMLEEDKTKQQRLNLTMELAQVRIKLGKYYKALETLKSINYKDASNQTQKERILIDTLYLEIMTNNKNVNFQATNRRCREAKKDINGAGLQLLVAECVSHYLNGQAYKVEDKTTKLKKSISELDQEKQAHWINFLYEMMGSDMRLDESKADRMNGRWMVGVDVLRGMVRSKEISKTA